MPQSDPAGYGQQPPMGPGHPDFGKPVDPRFAAAAPLDPDIVRQVGAPLSVWETVGEAFSIYRADFAKLWAATAVIAIPWVVIVFLARDAALPAHTVLMSGKIYLTSYNENANTYNLVSALASPLQYVILLISTGATYRILLGRRLNHPSDLGTAFGFAVGRLPKLLAVTICVAIAVIVSLLGVIIGAIYMGVALSLAVPVLMAEDLGVFASMGRSMELVRYFWWHVFGVFVISAILLIVLDVVVGGVVVVAIVNSSHSASTLLLVSAILNAIVLILVSPFSAGLATVIYVDMLLRKRDPHLARLLA